MRRRRERCRPKVLFSADRNVLIDVPKGMIFTLFGGARWKIGTGDIPIARGSPPDLVGYVAIYNWQPENSIRPELKRRLNFDGRRVIERLALVPFPTGSPLAGQARLAEVLDHGGLGPRN